MPDPLPPIVGFVALLACGLVLAWLALTLWTLLRLLHPPRRTYATALAQNRPGQPDQLPHRNGTARTYESWTLEWRTLRLPVWDMPGDAPDGPTFILTHGWGDSRIGALTRAQLLLLFASRIVMWDLPGHGNAPGHCMLGAHEHDALRALIEAVASSPPPCGRGQGAGLLPSSSPSTCSPVILLGWSLGAGVSLAAMSGWDAPAASHVRGVIAEAPYRLPQTPARNMLRSFGLPHAMSLPVAMTLARLRIGAPPLWCAAHGTFDRAALVRAVACPVLAIHGVEDSISPIEDGRAVAAAAPRGEMLEVAGAGHYSLWTGECAGAVQESVRAFVADRAR